MKTRAELTGAIAALEDLAVAFETPALRLLALECRNRADGYRARIAALPEEPEQPWTERERRLRLLVERSASGISNGLPTQAARRQLYDDCVAALAETPPPDPRDEALEAAEKSMQGAFGTVWAHCVTSERVGDAEKSARHGRLKSQIHDALAAIARARGGR